MSLSFEVKNAQLKFSSPEIAITCQRTGALKNATKNDSKNQGKKPGEKKQLKKKRFSRHSLNDHYKAELRFILVITDQLPIPLRASPRWRGRPSDIARAECELASARPQQWHEGRKGVE